jgi:hypothetical protein
MFAAINKQALVKPFIRTNQLEVDVKYKIEYIDIVLGQFGPRVVVTLAEGKVSLPERYIKIISASDITELKKLVQEKPVYLVSKGMVANTTNLEFVE